MKFSADVYGLYCRFGMKYTIGLIGAVILGFQTKVIPDVFLGLPTVKQIWSEMSPPQEEGLLCYTHIYVPFRVNCNN